MFNGIVIWRIGWQIYEMNSFQKTSCSQCFSHQYSFVTGCIIPDNTNLLVRVEFDKFSCCSYDFCQPSPGYLIHMTLKCFLIQKSKIILIIITPFYFYYCLLSFFYPSSSSNCLKLYPCFITTKYFPFGIFHKRKNLLIYLLHPYCYLLFIPSHIKFVGDFKAQIPKLQEKMV